MNWKLFLILVAIAVLLAIQSRAHEWYPSACCNETDCKPVPVEDVVLIDGRYVVTWGGQTLEFYKANPSPDGQYHICTRYGDKQNEMITLSQSWPKYKDGVMPTSPACFWAPQGF